MNVLSLEVSKARLDEALGYLVWWEVSLPMARVWNEMVCKVPTNPNHSVQAARLPLMLLEPLVHLITSVVAPLGEAGRRGLLSPVPVEGWLCLSLGSKISA